MLIWRPGLCPAGGLEHWTRRSLQMVNLPRPLTVVETSARLLGNRLDSPHPRTEISGVLRLATDR